MPRDGLLRCARNDGRQSLAVWRAGHTQEICTRVSHRTHTEWLRVYAASITTSLAAGGRAVVHHDERYHWRPRGPGPPKPDGAFEENVILLRALRASSTPHRSGRSACTARPLHRRNRPGKTQTQYAVVGLRTDDQSDPRNCQMISSATIASRTSMILRRIPLCLRAPESDAGHLVPRLVPNSP
jgi:hypothetical protein